MSMHIAQGNIELRAAQEKQLLKTAKAIDLPVTVVEPGKEGCIPEGHEAVAFVVSTFDFVVTRLSYPADRKQDFYCQVVNQFAKLNSNMIVQTFPLNEKGQLMERDGSQELDLESEELIDLQQECFNMEREPQ